MTRTRHQIIRAGMNAFHYTGAHLLFRQILSGVGIIFTLHHVRPHRNDAFQPNLHLEITPEFLRAALQYLKAKGVDVVTLDEAATRLRNRQFGRRFACFTFDDGYRDNRDYALPVMREFNAPFTVYSTTDFAEGTCPIWWLTLEQIIAKADQIETSLGGNHRAIDTSTPAAKTSVFLQMHTWLRDLPDDRAIHREIIALSKQHDVDVMAVPRELCLTLPELKDLSEDPLVTIGAHTLSHACLSKLDAPAAAHEMRGSKAQIEDTIQQEVNHFAFPYGDPAAASDREFALAQQAGFLTAVTTRPNVLKAKHVDTLTAIPRISLNGQFQEARYLPVLTSGAATAMWNGLSWISRPLLKAANSRNDG